MVLDSINKFAREGCDATETLQKIQRDAFRLEDRARQAAYFHDNVAGRNLVGITVTNLDISRRIDLPKNFSSCLGAGNNCFFTHNDASGCVKRFWYEEISSDVAVANVFFKGGGDRIVTVRRHLAHLDGARYARNAIGSIRSPVSNAPSGRSRQVAPLEVPPRCLWRHQVQQKRFGQRTLRRNNESKKSCDHPNRLNLLTLTTGRTVCSNFLREIRV